MKYVIVDGVNSSLSPKKRRLTAAAAAALTQPARPNPEVIK